MTSGISFSGVYKKYGDGDSWVVSDFNLEVAAGEFFCLVGPSGCGKTTVLKMALGLEQIEKGQINKPPHISMVFQSGALFPWLSARDNVAFGMKFLSGQKSEIKNNALKYLDMVELSGFSDKFPRELSGGQRQRVGIARALAVEPEVLLLDEPFSALDAITSEKLHNTLLKVWHKTQITVLMVSHLLEEAVILADRIGVMKDGKLREIVPVSLDRPRDSTSEKFLNLVEKVRKSID